MTEILNNYSGSGKSLAKQHHLVWPQKYLDHIIRFGWAHPRYRVTHGFWAMWAGSKLDLPNGWKLAQGRRVSKSMLKQTLQSPSWSLDAGWILTSKWSIRDMGQACGGLYAHKMTRMKRRISCFLQFKSSHTYFPLFPASLFTGSGMRWAELNPNMAQCQTSLPGHYDWELCRKDQITSVRVCNISQRDFISLHFLLVNLT